MSASADLVPVDPARVGEFIPYVETLLRSVCEKTDASNWEDDRQALLAGRALLWIVWDGDKLHGAGTTEIVTIGGRRHCYVTAFAGKGRKTWLHLIGSVEAYAARHGCKSVRLLGRHGWRRLLQGFLPRLVLLEKEI